MDPNVSTKHQNLYQNTCPILKREIRLLRVQPATDWNNELTGQLHAYDLDHENIEEYVALSYAWGTQPQDCPISCNGTNLGVTETCLSALRALRHHLAVCTVWVDQICIDQTNDKEKGTQVNLMSSIYTRAQVVYVWLGQLTLVGPNKESLAGSLERYLPKRRLPDGLSQQEDHIASLVSANEDVNSSLKRGSTFPPSWTALAKAKDDNVISKSPGYQVHCQLTVLLNIFERPYFERRWIVQELAQAQDIKVLIGHLEISWSLVSTAAEFISQSSREMVVRKSIWPPCLYRDGQPDARRLLGGRIKNIQMIDMMKSLVAYPEKSLQGSQRLLAVWYWTLLRLCRGFRVTVPHDLIYAVRPLAERLAGVSGEHSLPHPMYGQPEAELYAEFTVWLIKQGLGPELLSSSDTNLNFCSGGGSPSWCVDFKSESLADQTSRDFRSDLIPNSPILQLVEAELKLTSGSHAGLDYRVSEQILATPLAQHGSTCTVLRTLTVRGFVVDKITHTHLLNKAELPYKGFRAVAEFLRPHWNRLSSDAKETIERGRAYAQSEEDLTDLDSLALWREKLFYSIFHDDQARHRSPVNLTRHQDDLQMFTLAATSPYNDTFGVTSQAWPFYTWDDVRPADEIVILDGVADPLVIRSYPGGQWRLAGRVHVMSLMLGAAWNLEDARNEREFVLV